MRPVSLRGRSEKDRMIVASYRRHFGSIRRTVGRRMAAIVGPQVKMVAPSRNHLYRRRLQVMIDAGPRNHLYLLGQQVKIRSCPRNQLHLHKHSRINTRTALARQSENAGNPPLSTAAWAFGHCRGVLVQAALRSCAAVGGRQFHGRSSGRRNTGRAAMRSRTSASQA